MREWLFAGALVLTLSACTEVKPVAVEMGKDSCHACKMAFTDPRFGAQVILKKGKVYKFDALECMVEFHRTHREEVRKVFLPDFTRPGEWVDSEKAVFLRVETLRSPMGEGIVAGRSEADLRSRKELPPGPYLGWKDLLAYLEKPR